VKIIEIDPRILQAVSDIVTDLAAAQYAKIEAKTRSQRLTAEEMREAVAEYGVELAMPSQEMLSKLDVVRVVHAETQEWSVRCPLWGIDVGRTDLTLELTLSDVGEAALKIEVDGIHVL
jgi:hypothetical protein